jgi:uncharacterized membrane protein
MKAMELFKRLSIQGAILLVAAYFLFGGISHFTNSDFFIEIMPPYLPYHLEIVWISGAFEILGGLGILLPKTRAMAGYGLIALTIAVTPANIHMAMNPELFPDVPVALLYVRLLLQVLLLWLIWFSFSRERAASSASG